MKIFRYEDNIGAVYYGCGDPTPGAEQSNPGGRPPTRLIGDFLSGMWRDSGEPAEIAKLLAPVAPPVFWCIGINYREHAKENGSDVPEHPMLFMKSPSSLQSPGEAVQLPRALRSDKVDFEGELAVVIGKRCKNVSAENALDYVLGYTCANDVSARDWQKEWGGGQFCRGKTFDTFAPLGPWIVTADEIPDPNKLRLKTTVSGEVMQDATTADMIFDIPTLIAFLSGSTTLPAGSVILTGTPSGVGMGRTPPRWLQPGDTVTVEIEAIGALTNPIIEEMR